MKKTNYSKAIKNLALGSAILYAIVGSSIDATKLRHQSVYVSKSKIKSNKISK